jgi:hypothetical protein
MNAAYAGDSLEIVLDQGMHDVSLPWTLKGTIETR